MKVLGYRLLLKTEWLRAFLVNNNNFRYCVSREVFRIIGGIDFLLCCYFSTKKVPVKLSWFYSQALLYWKMRYKQNFILHDVPTWNCKFILFRNRSLFFFIWSVTRLLDETSCVLPFEEFCTKYNFHCSHRQYDKVTKSIPTAFLCCMWNFAVMEILCCENPK